MDHPVGEELAVERKTLVGLFIAACPVESPRLLGAVDEKNKAILDKFSPNPL